LAVGNGSESGAARYLERAPIIASSGTGEVFDWVSDDLFDLELRLHDFTFQVWLGEIGEIRVRHRMAADLETLRVKIAHLAGIEITGRAQESSGEVESCAEAELAKHGRSSDKVGLAAIVERDANAGFGRIAQRIANVQAAPAGFLHARHLGAKGVDRQNVAYVTGFGLAELTAREFQLVVHQEHNA